MATRTAGIDKMTKLRHCQSMYLIGHKVLPIKDLQYPVSKISPPFTVYGCMGPGTVLRVLKIAVLGSYIQGVASRSGS